MRLEIEDTKWPKTLFDDEESREGKVHLSYVTKSLMDRAGIGYKGAGFNDMELTAEIGLMWEDALSKIMGDRYATRPPHIEKDGIWMALDGIGPDPDGRVPLVVEEYKATWKSTKRPPTEDFRYMVQVKSYCHAVGTPVAIMRIFHLMGDYRGSGPIYRVARIEFDPYELERNWEMVLNEKERLIQEGKWHCKDSLDPRT